MHPLEFQEHSTGASLYCIALFSDYMEFAATWFYEQQKRELREICDIVELRELYRKISTLLGDDSLMERLNLMMRQRFMIVFPMQSFLQGMTEELLFALTTRDDETGKLMFQLI